MATLADYNIQQLKELCKQHNQPSFRAAQLFKWTALSAAFQNMSDIPSSFRDALAKEFTDTPIKIIQAFTSCDGSEKYLYQLADGNIIEGVFMPNNYGNTLCVSTQVGCRMGCAFCASGIGGLVRNLSCGEIAGQVYAVNKLKGGNLSERKIANLVLMGSGEPLDNIDNVLAFLDVVTAEQGLNISRRSISVSTCGLPEGIKRLADEGRGVTLSLSLHATTQEARAEIMPITKKYSLFETMQAVRYYFNATARRVVFEYSMIKDKNMNFHDAKRLAEFCKGISAHVNLIMLNPVPEKNLVGCTKLEAQRFLQKLTSLGVSATLRRSLGTDISAACGQLRNLYVGQNTPVSSDKKP